MATIDWRLQGHFVVTCSCDYGCPCQFMSRPSKGSCHAAMGGWITKGHFGEVQLDGQRFAALLSWPGAVHEGHGTALPVVDERATPEQRQALLAILAGAESEPGATVFNVFASTYETMHEPLFRRIDFEFDLAKREASFTIPGVLEAGAEPIRNPVTNAPIPIRLLLPDGFEFTDAQFASGRAKTIDSPIHLDWTASHAHLYDMDMTGAGPVRQ